VPQPERRPPRGEASSPRLQRGFSRIDLRLRQQPAPTPGDIARAAGVPLDDLGPIAIHGDTALVDVRHAMLRQARSNLERLGPTRIADQNWRWLRLQIGRNHGLTIGQLRKIMAANDALPLGRISINNTHSLIGILDQKFEAVLARFAEAKINGYPVRPDEPAPGLVKGSAAYEPVRS
jgi:hypothetical protein